MVIGLDAIMRWWFGGVWVVLQSAVVVMFLVACGVVEDLVGDVDTANGLGMFSFVSHKPIFIGILLDGVSVEQ